MSSFYYDFNTRVHLRRDPQQYGEIGSSPTGAVYDQETGTQDVFWLHPGADIVTSEKIADLMSEAEYQRLAGEQ